MTTWPQLRLGEVIELKRGYDLPQQERQLGDVPIVSSSGVSGRHSQAMVRGPGVVTGRYGTIGEVFYIANDFWPLNTTLYVRDFKGNDPRFISYFLRTINFNAYSDKGAVPGVNRNHLHEALVRLPPVPTQRAISATLGALDEKIDLNRRMSQTLESIAQAIFKSWFVDFEPVRALAAGEDWASVAGRLGLSKEAVAWFPDSFRPDASIPTGWTSSTLGEQAKLCGGLLQTGPFGSQLHASDYVVEGVPVVMPQDLVGRRVSTERIAKVSAETATGLSRHALRPGDVVYSRRGDVERHAIVGVREEGWLCGTGCLLVRMGPGWASQAYLSETLNERTTREWIVRHAVGATMPNLNTSILSAVPILVPSIPLLTYFESVAGPLRIQQAALSAEAESLASVRDELLPKLLTGELSVIDDEA